MSGLSIFSSIGTTWPGDALNVGFNKMNAHWHDYKAVSLANQAGAALTTGDAVALSATCSDAVVLADVQASHGYFVLNRGGIATSATSGEWAAQGRSLVTVQGAVNNGAWLRKSATAKSLEDSGVLVSAAITPGGALAIAETSSTGAGAGTVIANMLGVTLPALGAPTARGGLFSGAAADTLAEAAVGHNGLVLMLDPSGAGGVIWQIIKDRKWFWLKAIPRLPVL